MTGAASEGLERVIAQRDAWRELAFARDDMLVAFLLEDADRNGGDAVCRAIARVNAAIAALRALSVEPFGPRDRGKFFDVPVSAEAFDPGELVAGDAAAEVVDDDEQLGAGDGRAANAISAPPATSRSSSAPFAGRDPGELPGALERR